MHPAQVFYRLQSLPQQVTKINITFYHFTGVCCNEKNLLPYLIPTEGKTSICTCQERYW
jgi:hypothetical protein